jgi:alkylhydroperoxidase family enzyme
MTDEQLRDLSRYRESSVFTPREKLALDLAVAMTRTPPDVGDGLFAELQKHFTSAQLVELVTEIGLANLRGRFNTTFRCRVAGYSGDAYCPLPTSGDGSGPDMIS